MKIPEEDCPVKDEHPPSPARLLYPGQARRGGVFIERISIL
jgi:hypothetical protein